MLSEPSVSTGCTGRADGRWVLRRRGVLAAATVALLSAAGLLTLACYDDTLTDPRFRIYRVRACDELFRVRIADPAVAREADRLLGRGHQKILMGTVRTGSGGFNAPWSWHLDPATIGFAEVTIELCDGCPSFLQQERSEWIGRTFCPWTTEVVGRE